MRRPVCCLRQHAVVPWDGLVVEARLALLDILLDGRALLILWPKPTGKPLEAYLLMNAGD